MAKGNNKGSELGKALTILTGVVVASGAVCVSAALGISKLYNEYMDKKKENMENK